LITQKEDDWLYTISSKRKLIDFNFKEIWQYRDLLLLFVKRDIITLYKQTILGPLWYIIQPLFTSVIFTLIFNKLGNINTGIDITISLIGIALGMCILPLIFLGNLISIKGPLFYVQQRIGKNGKPFKIIKLRTMIVNAEQNGAIWSTINDKRITRFGKFLRHTRLDEIPQFYNVIKGDMCIIGPRPERPYFVNELAQIIPFYETRHMVKPGLTGWAQVSTRYGSSVEDSLVKLQYDLYYIKHRSVFLDFSIAIKTLSTILYYRGQ